MTRKESMKIEIGDEVTVCFRGYHEVIKGIVLHMPQATGECWIIETSYSVHYVQSFESIWKEKPNAALTG